MKKSLRRMIGLGILIGLMLLIFGGVMAEGELPTEPNLEFVWQEERIANMLLEGPIRGYTEDRNDEHFEVDGNNPALRESGVWQISFKHPARSMIVELLTKDYSDDYTMVYLQEYKNIGNVSTYTYTSCQIVSAGDYYLRFLVTFEDNSQYFKYVLFSIDDDDDAEHPSLTEKVNAIVAEATSAAGNDVWAKALYLHDWLTANAYYDNAYEYYGADGVLLRGYGVCDSYSKAYLLLCQAAGIPVSRVTGTAGGPHAWNAIEIGGEWYYVDATWDDPNMHDTEPVSGYENHNYFCLNDEIISWDHTNDRTLFDTPCTSLEANWGIKNPGKNWNELGNYIMNKSGDDVTGIGGTYSEKILEQINGGNSYFTYPCDDTFYTLVYDEYDNWTGYYTPVAVDRDYAIRRWTLLAAKMSQAPFTVDGNICAVGVSYDSVNNRFVVCRHVWANEVCTQCGAACLHIAGFDSQSLCVLCGTACPHKHTTEETEFTGSGTTITEIAGDDQHHRVSGTGNRTVICNDCGQVIREETNIQISREEEHAYFNGVCTVTGCGHTCTHTFDANGICSFCDYVNNPACTVTYDADESILQISGNGAVGINHIPQGCHIDRVIIGEGITIIGPNVFAKLQDGVRIDFQQTVRPTIYENAFGGTMAICRYTSSDSSWSTAPVISGVSWVKVPTFNAMKMPDWQQVMMDRIVEKGQSVTLSTPIGQNIGAIQMVIKDTADWSTALCVRVNLDEPDDGVVIDENNILHISFGTRVPEGETEKFITGHLYNVELFALPATDSDPILWEGYWNTIMTVVPEGQTGIVSYPQIFMNKTVLETGYYALYVTAYDPNASNVWIVLDGEAFQGRPDNYFTWVDGYNEPGTHTLCAVSMLADGTTRTSETITFTAVRNETQFELYTGNVIPVTFTDGNTEKSLELFPQTITIGKDITYTIHPVNQTLGKDALGNDEQVWYDSWLDDMTDWDAGMDLPCYLRRQEANVPHNLLLNDETGSRTVTIAHSRLQAGHTYKLNVEIRSAKCTPVVIARTFTVVAAEDPEDPRPTVSLYFEGNQSGPYSMNLPLYDEFSLHASAPGAAVVRFWNGDGYEYLNDWMDGEWTGGLDFHFKTWRGGETQYFIQAYYGDTEDAPSWNELDWSTASISNIVTVNATQSASIQKVIPSYTVSPADSVVTQGDYYTVTLTNTSELDAAGVYVGADLYNGNFGNHYERNGNKIVIPTADLEAGYYTLAIYTETEGAGYAQVPHYFRVVAPSTLPANGFMITTTKTPGADGKYTVESYEDFGVTFYAPDREGYDKYYRFFDGQCWWDREWQRSVTLDSELDPGDWEIYAEVVYLPHDKNLEVIRYESAHLAFTATSQGPSGITLSAPGSYTVTENGTGYTVTIVNSAGQTIDPTLYDGEYWELALEEAHGPWLDRFSSDNGEPLAGSYTFPERISENEVLFEAGKTYKVRFHLNVRGYDPVNEEVCFAAVSPSTGQQETLTLTVDDIYDGSQSTIYSVPAHTSIRVAVTAAKNSNITAVRVLNGDHWEVWPRGDDYWRDWRFGGGIYGFVAQGTTDSAVWEAENFDWGNFDWDDLDWSITSNVVTVKMTTLNGQLGRPTLSLDKAAYNRGEKIIATVGKVDNSEWYHLHISPVDENGETYGNWVYDVTKEATGTGTLTFEIQTAHIENGRYAVWVDNNGTGYMGNGSDFCIITISTGDVRPLTSLDLPERISTCQNIEIYAYVSGAEDIWLDIRKEGDPGWRNERHEGGEYAVWDFGEAFAGTYTFTLYAHRENEQGEIIEEIAETATCIVEAPNDALDDVDIEGIPDIIQMGMGGASNGVTGSFTRDPDAEWYQIRLVYRGLNGDQGDQEIRNYQRYDSSDTISFTFAASDFSAAGVYEIQVIGGAAGYDASSTSRWILVTEVTDSSLTLTVNGENGASRPVNINASEDVTIRIHAPGATAIRLFDGERWDWWDSRCLDNDGWAEIRRLYNSGEYMFVAQAAYDTGYNWQTFNNWENFDAYSTLDWTKMSNQIHVSVSASGDTDPAVISGDIGPVTRGELLTVTVGSAGNWDSDSRATNLYAYIQNENGWSIGEGIGKGNLKFNDYPITFQFPTGHLEAGRYYLIINSSAAGYNTTRVCIPFTVTEPVAGQEEDDPFIFQVEEETSLGAGRLLMDKNFSISAYAKGAYRIDINIQETDGDDTFTWGPFDGDHVYLVNCQLGEGEYEFTAVAHYKDENNVETTRNSAPITRKVISRGTMPAPTIRTQGKYTVQGGISFRIDGLEEGNYWWVEVYDTDSLVTYEDGNQGWPRVARWDANSNSTIPETFTISNGLVNKHRYEIHACVDKEGFYSGNTSINVVVTDVPSGNISLTVNRSSMADQYWYSSKEMQVKVSYDENGDRPTAVRILNGDHWEYWWGEGEDFQRYWSFGDCTILVYAEATWQNIDFDAAMQNGWANFNWDDVAWSAGSNTIVVTIGSPYGEMKEPVFAINNLNQDGSIPWGDDLVINIVDTVPMGTGQNAYPIESGWFFCNLNVMRGEGNDARWERANHNYNYQVNSGLNYIPTYNLDDGCRYQIEIGADAEGYFGRCSYLEFTLGERQPSTQPIKSFKIDGEAANKSILILKDIQLTAYHSDAEWYYINITKEEDENWHDSRDNCNSGMLLDWWRTDEAGTYTLTAYAHGHLPEGQTNNDGSNTWEDTIGTLTVTVTSNGRTGAPTIDADTVVIGAYENLYVRIKPGEHANEAHVNLDRVVSGEGEDLVFSRWIPWTPNEDGEDEDGYTGRVWLNVEGLLGTFRLHVDNSGDGYGYNRSSQIVHIVEYPWDVEPRLELPASLTTIEEEAFAGTAARVVIIPDSVTTIGSRAFANSNIQVVVIEGSETSISADAFDECNVQVVYGYGSTGVAEGLAEQLNTLYYNLWRIGGNG